mmetsp:Transcript_2945/g.5521  ORF Transcript_2945/g.5521 Transcript_2945/m.5521 type:complete len:501 (+) Transcript_2945:119-1621(+)
MSPSDASFSENHESFASAAPMLKVMRLQSPDLAFRSTPSLTSPVLSSALILPDSFGVIHIGETFTAYIGALNVNPTLHVQNLSISATLQTPTRNVPMPSILENKFPMTPQERLNYKPIHIKPQEGVDAIISRPLEETGQHMLRVEVSYGGLDPTQQSLLQGDMTNQYDATGQNDNNGRKFFRKFYRFHVSSPLHIRELTLRGGESTCFVSLAVENAAPIESGCAGGLTVSQNTFQPCHGLCAQKIQNLPSLPDSQKTAVELFDDSGRLNPGESKRYMFEVKASSENATLKGIAMGDELGKAVITWYKTMGEAGRIASTFIYCPSCAIASESSKNMATDEANDIQDDDNFVVHRSGLSVDVAASAANRSVSYASSSEFQTFKTLEDRFPVTVEPISPPNTMHIGVPVELSVLVVNHGAKSMNLQLQMRLPQMKGVLISGQSFRNLGTLPPNGGSVISKIHLIAISPGLFFVSGCFIVDLDSGVEIRQPHLFSVLVVETDAS